MDVNVSAASGQYKATPAAPAVSDTQTTSTSYGGRLSSAVHLEPAPLNYLNQPQSFTFKFGRTIDSTTGAVAPVTFLRPVRPAVEDKAVEAKLDSAVASTQTECQQDTVSVQTDSKKYKAVSQQTDSSLPSAVSDLIHKIEHQFTSVDGLSIEQRAAFNEDVLECRRQLRLLNHRIQTCSKYQLPAGVVEVRSSSAHGNGCFALKDIQKNEEIGSYAGNIVLRKKAANSEEFIAFRVYTNRQNQTSIYWLDADTYVAWTGITVEGGFEVGINGRNQLKYLNHSTKPNARVEARYMIRSADNDEEAPVSIKELDSIKLHVIARKSIKAGQEIVFDYLDGCKQAIDFTRNLVQSPTPSQKDKVHQTIQTLFTKKYRLTIDEEIAELPKAVKTRHRKDKANPAYVAILTSAWKKGVSMKMILGTDPDDFPGPQKVWDKYLPLWEDLSSRNTLISDESNTLILSLLTYSDEYDQLTFNVLDASLQLYWLNSGRSGTWREYASHHIKNLMGQYETRGSKHNLTNQQLDQPEPKRIKE